MPLVKLETAPAHAAAADTGGTLFGWQVVFSTPTSPQYIVDVPDDGMSRLPDLVKAGQVVDYRPMHTDYRPLGWPVFLPTDWRALFTAGDTFPLMGITDDVRKRGNWGAKRLGHVDTPVEAGHPFFQGKTLVRALDAVPGGAADAHGTHTLSTAAGGEGIAYDAEMYTYPALIGGTGSEASVANGIRWCGDQGCQVMTLSIGGSASQAIDAAVDYARQRGVVVVAAAGNGGGVAVPGSPARAATIIAMACDRNLVHASFTDGMNWTLPNRVFGQGVNVVAGVPGGTTGVMSGTSMACPHVAGCALLLAAAGFSEAQILAYLAGHQVAVS